ncbi:hypothetical protein Tco_1492713 [Tanacetum coccineum]
MKKEEYDIWAMEMEHYLEYIDNDVWKKSCCERKGRHIETILLMAIPKEHLRRFHGMDDAKEIWEAIRTRFSGNRKFKEAVIPNNYSQFGSSGAEVSTEDANHKFLRSLPPVELTSPQISSASASKMLLFCFLTAKVALQALSFGHTG